MIKNLRNKCKNKKGFTMVELIVVIVIILVLAAVLVPQLLKYVDKANEASCKADAATILSQVQADYAASQASDETGITMPNTVNGVDVAKGDENDVAAAGKAVYAVAVTTGSGAKPGTQYKDVVWFSYNNKKYTANWSSAAGWTVTESAKANP